jgi:hypothetical protein
MSFHGGALGSCRWSCLVGDLTPQDEADFLQHLRSMIGSVVPGMVVLDITHDMPMPSAVQRKKITDILGSRRDLHIIGGHAFVSNSPMGRGLLTAINWVIRPPFEESVFSRPVDAIAWLAQRNRTVDGASVLQSITRAFPGFEQLRW